jgi:hypothetical protein
MTDLPAKLTFYVADDFDEDGEPTGWAVRSVEPATVVYGGDGAEVRLLVTQAAADGGGVFTWEAYRYDFGENVLDGDGQPLGEQWAYGSSAELLKVSL